MTRSEHLSFCSVCTNRKFTTEVGFICSLTDKKADFDISCPQFSLDIEQRNARNKKYRDEIDTHLNNEKTFINSLKNAKVSLDYLVKPDNHLPLSVDTRKETIIKESSKNKYLLLISIIVLPIAIAYSAYKEDRNFQDMIWLLGVVLVIWLLLIYLYRSNAEIVRFGPQGIIIHQKEFIPWNTIDYIHRKVERGDVNNTDFLVVRLNNLTFREINVEYSNIGINQLAAITYCYIRYCKKN